MLPTAEHLLSERGWSGISQKMLSGMSMNSKRPMAELAVWLGQTQVGRLLELANDSSLFVFDQSYLTNAARPVLSLSFYGANGELDAASVPAQMKLPSFFSNLLPEGELRTYLASLAGVKAVRDMPLLQILGEDLPGAVVVRPQGDGTPPEHWESQEALPLTENDGPLRFSLAGVQMKFSGTGSPERGLTIPAGGRGGHWILKLPSRAYPLLPENEHSMMTFASHVGIQTAETGLVNVSEITGIPERFRSPGHALWVKRFDRTERNERIHMEDFNQLYGQMPDDKFRNYSHGNMAADLGRIAGLDALGEFIRRLIFSAAVGNNDMHLKNWTLLYPDRRTPVLSPAYDLVSTVAYIDDPMLALSVAKQKDVRLFDRKLLDRFAEALPAPKAFVVDTALGIAEKVVKEWPHIAPSLPLDLTARDRVSRQLELFPLTSDFIEN